MSQVKILSTREYVSTSQRQTHEW